MRCTNEVSQKSQRIVFFAAFAKALIILQHILLHMLSIREPSASSKIDMLKWNAKCWNRLIYSFVHAMHNDKLNGIIFYRNWSNVIMWSPHLNSKSCEEFCRLSVWHHLTTTCDAKVREKMMIILQSPSETLVTAKLFHNIKDNISFWYRIYIF